MEKTAVEPSNSAFGERMKRFFEATGAKKKIELARILGIQSGSFSTAVRRGVIPPGWYFVLSDKFGVSIDWLHTGEGPMFRLDRQGPCDIWSEIRWVVKTYERLGRSPEEVGQALDLMLKIAERQTRERTSHSSKMK